VLKGNTFIDSLTIKDFEVYEDGKLQKIEAVYLVKKAAIKKEEGKTKFSPEVARSFVLYFEIQEYVPKIGEALDYFFNRVILPTDTLIVISPVKTYQFKKESFDILSKPAIVAQLKEKLRKDVVSGNAEYRSLINDLENLFSLDVEADMKKSMYLDLANGLKNLKVIDEKKMLGFADFLKTMDGQKHVFLFYQKELIPILPEMDPTSAMQDLSLFTELNKDISFDAEKIKQAFSDSSISVHSLFFTETGMFKDLDVIGTMAPLRVKMFDQSSEIFGAFKEMARATGGIADSSANPAFLLKKAADSSENYYLVYYSPSNEVRDGKFREIKVRVKNKNYNVIHRAGYFAD
jgi:hypothetical protein